MTDSPEGTNTPSSIDLDGRKDSAVKPDEHPAVLVRRRENGQFVPGQSGNPAGRAPNHGLNLKEWINELGRPNDQGRAKYNKSEWRQIAKDEGEAPAKREAAQIMLRGEHKGWFKGRPQAGDDLDRIFDRTVGRAPQAVYVLKQELPRLDDMQATLGALLEAQPGLLSLLPGGGGVAELPEGTGEPPNAT